MADLAMIFHWQLPAMDAMELEELVDWRERAVKRWNDANTPPEPQ